MRNTRWSIYRSGSRRDHPRIRGEYRYWKNLPLPPWGSPPHTRGILSSFIVHSAGLRIPPHARGIHIEAGTKGTWHGITPACAGNTIKSDLRRIKAKDHPRLRGEYSEIYSMISPEMGSPPHARGILRAVVLIVWQVGITPAYAGNTANGFSGRPGRPHHPRLRGEYWPPTFVRNTEPGSPPLARGIRHVKLQDMLIGGITPACAGNTRSDAVMQAWPGITPACAGNTVAASGSSRLHWDHPRMCREYTFRRCNAGVAGDHPRMRGEDSS